MDEEETGPKTVDATERTLAIIAALRSLDGARISELSEELDMSKSSIHSHLATLREHYYVSKDGDEYRLSLWFLDFAEYVRSREPVFRAAKPKVKEVAEQTEEVASLMAEDHGRGVFLFRRTGGDTTRPAAVGNKVYLHATAGGKAILAHLHEEKIADVIDKWGLPQMTGNTITDRDALSEELEQIRTRGVAFNDEEDLEGLRAVAVPVMDSNNRIAGSMSVYGPAHRMNGEFYEEEIPDLLLECANDVQLDVAFDERHVI